MPVRVLFFALFVTLVASGAAADELRLQNGNQFSGTVVSLSDGVLKFKAYNTELQIPWSEVVQLTVDDEIVVQRADGGSTTVRGSSLDVANVHGLSRPASTEEPRLKVTGGANAGFIATSGNTNANTLRVDADTVLNKGDYRYSFSGAVNRAEDSGRLTTRNWTFNGAHDRFLTKRRNLYLNSSGILTNDVFRDIELRTALTVGLGVQLIGTSRTSFALEGGIGWVNESFVSAPDNKYVSGRESGRLDIVLDGQRVTLFHRHDGYFGAGRNLFVKMQNGVRFRLINGFVTTLQMDLDYDRSPAAGRRKTDRSVALTFGYRF